METHTAASIIGNDSAAALALARPIEIRRFFEKLFFQSFSFLRLIAIEIKRR